MDQEYSFDAFGECRGEAPSDAHNQIIGFELDVPSSAFLPSSGTTLTVSGTGEMSLVVYYMQDRRASPGGGVVHAVGHMDSVTTPTGEPILDKDNQPITDALRINSLSVTQASPDGSGILSQDPVVFRLGANRVDKIDVDGVTRNHRSTTCIWSTATNERESLKIGSWYIEPTVDAAGEVAILAHRPYSLPGQNVQPDIVIDRMIIPAGLNRIERSCHNKNVPAGHDAYIRLEHDGAAAARSLLAGFCGKVVIRDTPPGAIAP